MPIHACGVCHKRLSRSTKLSEHMRSHTGERPFQCPTCYTNFARSYDLTKHKELHTGIYKHRCEFDDGTGTGRSWGCGKEFHKKGDLNRHLRRDGADQCRQSRPRGSEKHTEANGPAIGNADEIQDAGQRDMSPSYERRMPLDFAIDAGGGAEECSSAAANPRAILQDRLRAARADHLTTAPSTTRGREKSPFIAWSAFRISNPIQPLNEPPEPPQVTSLSEREVILDQDFADITELETMEGNAAAAEVLTSMKDDQSVPTKPAVISSEGDVSQWSHELLGDLPLLSPHNSSRSDGYPSDNILWSRPPRVLYVDNDLVQREPMLAFLQSIGCIVDATINGFRAVEMVKQITPWARAPYDMIFMNMRSSGPSHFYTCHTIRQSSAVSIIGVVPYQTSAHETYFPSGMDDVLVAPFTKKLLIAMLKKHVKRLERSQPGKIA